VVHRMLGSQYGSTRKSTFHRMTNAISCNAMQWQIGHRQLYTKRTAVTTSDSANVTYSNSHAKSTIKDFFLNVMHWIGDQKQRYTMASFFHTRGVQNCCGRKLLQL